MKCPVPVLTAGKTPSASVLVVIGILAAIAISVKAQQSKPANSQAAR